MEQKEIRIVVKNFDGETAVVGLEKILELAGIKGNAFEVSVQAGEGGNALKAGAYFGRSTPEAYLTAKDKEGREMQLASSHLPEKGSPNVVKTMLYGGYEDGWTEDVVAGTVVEIGEPKGDVTSEKPKKVVYVNTDEAVSAPWDDPLEEQDEYRF